MGFLCALFSLEERERKRCKEVDELLLFLLKLNSCVSEKVYWEISLRKATSKEEEKNFLEKIIENLRQSKPQSGRNQKIGFSITGRRKNNRELFY